MKSVQTSCMFLGVGGGSKPATIEEELLRTNFIPVNF